MRHIVGGIIIAFVAAGRMPRLWELRSRLHDVFKL